MVIVLIAPKPSGLFERSYFGHFILEYWLTILLQC